MRLFIVAVMLLSIAGCSQPNYLVAKYMQWDARGITFFLDDGRTFMGSVEDNPHYLKIDQRKYRGVVDVYFSTGGGEERIYLKGTGLFGLGDINFMVREIKK